MANASHPSFSNVPDRRDGSRPRSTLDPIAPLRTTSAPPHSFPAPSWRKPHATWTERLSGDVAQLVARPRGATTIVARFPSTRARADLEALLASLAPRAIEVRRLESVASEVPATMADAVRRVLHKAAIVAAALGALGALAGALVVEGEALLPSLGWTPGPLVGAAIGGGLFGALGFLVGAIAMLFLPSLALDRETEHGTFVIVRARPFDVEAVAAHLVEAGGAIAAFGEG